MFSKTLKMLCCAVRPHIQDILLIGAAVLCCVLFAYSLIVITTGA